MNYIGEKIKELRRKNDMTQEKLADYLCVSYQSVSKWETGVTSPDLSLIAPIARLFHVTTDDLFGMNIINEDARRKELEAAHKQTTVTGDVAEREKIADIAIAEYPGDMRYLSWKADCMFYTAYETEDSNLRHAGLEKVIHIYETVIENTNDAEIKNNAIQMIVLSLVDVNRREEAMKYANLYPENIHYGRNDLIGVCLLGEERRKHDQEKLLDCLEKLVNCLYLDNMEARKISEQIIKLIIPDGNYLGLHGAVMQGLLGQADDHANNGRYDEAIDALKRARYHAIEYDKIDSDAPGIYRYTAPLLGLVEIDTRQWLHETSGRQVEWIFDYMKHSCYDPIRDRKDFKALYEE